MGQVEDSLLEKAAQKAAQVVLDKDLKKTDDSAPPQNPASPFQQASHEDEFSPAALMWAWVKVNLCSPD